MSKHKHYEMTLDTLQDKILGGWCGKAYGCMMGEPMEFKAQGEIYEGSLDIDPKAPTTWLHNEDDMYVNMALLEIMRDKGLTASLDDYAKVFRESDFMLWHANGQARQNLKDGIPPGRSGHPFYNPHADDIDFQIECDFIGLVSPGLPLSATRIADQVGHLMNYGDGYYAGVFLASLYAAAFIETDRVRMIEMAVQTIPADCDYAAMLRDLLAFYREDPDDWRQTWQKIEDKWNFDLCPWAKTEVGRFNIQGHFNGLYVMMGVLYGGGDYIESISICTRCGQDTDSNVGNCGGIMGTIVGFEGLPQAVRADLAPYMDRDYNHTSLSNNSASALCYELAVSNIEQSGGRVDETTAHIPAQPFHFEGEREVSFINMQFVDTYKPDDEAITWHGDWHLDEEGWGKETLTSASPGDYAEVSFTGTCVYMQGNLKSDYGMIDIYIDGELVQRRDCYVDPRWNNQMQSTAVWLTGLADDAHTLKVVISEEKNPRSSGTSAGLGRVVSYRGKVAALPD
jgi:hypothetical protein